MFLGWSFSGGLGKMGENRFLVGFVELLRNQSLANFPIAVVHVLYDQGRPAQPRAPGANYNKADLNEA